MIQLTANGSIGQDAKVNEAGTTKVVNFSLAVNIGYGDKKTTQWIECSKFGDKTEIANFLKKGTKVLVTGEPSLRTWQKDEKSGTQLSLRIAQIELLGGNKENEQQNQDLPTPKKLDQNKQKNYSQDDLPF